MKKVFTILGLFLTLTLSGQMMIPGVVASLSQSGGESSTLLDGIISYWNFDEASGNLIDQVGDNDGTVDATYGATGKIDDCYTFDGAGDEISFGNDADLKPATGLSISCWIKQYLYQSTIIATYTGGDGWFLQTNETGKPYFLVYSGWSNDDITGGTTVTTGEPTVWYHIVITYDETNANLYVNGSSDASQVAMGLDLTYGASNVFIGYDDTFEYRLSENLDEVGIWNRALTSDEVTELYNSGSGKTYPFE